MNKAVFLDRDGTLIEHYDYITKPEQVQLLPRVSAGLKRLRERGFLLVIITNQSAVARGMISEKRLDEIHDRLIAELAKEGAYLDKIYYCPYHPEARIDKYRRDSDLRKPAPGMFHLAARELEIELAESWMIGDDDRDILAGQSAGCRTIMLEARGSTLVRKGQSQPDFIAVNLQEAVNLVIRHSQENRETQEQETPPVPQQDEQPPAEKASPAEPETPPEQKQPPEDTAIPTEPETPPDAAAAAEPEPAPPAETDETEPEPDATAAAEPEPAEETTAPPPAEPAAPDKEPEPASARTAESEVQQQMQQLQESIPFLQRRKTRRTPPESETDKLLQQILRELKTLNRSQHAGKEDFSIGKVIAGILQMLVIACLIMAFRSGMAVEPNYDAARNTLLLALTLQTMALTMLSIHK